MPNVTVYVMTVWHNLPTKDSPIDATNLNHLEQGIKNVTDFVNTINASSGLYLCQTPFTTALKNKLDGIEAGANNYTLPTASASTKGGVKVDGVTITIDANGVISAAAAAIPNLSNLSDVNISSLADGQVLKWDATNSKWINANESGGTTINELNDVGDVNITNPTAGQGLVYDAQNEEWINAIIASTMASLTDVDLTGLADGNTLVWDTTNQEWIPGEAGDVLGYNETLQVLGDASQAVPSIPVVYSTNEVVIGNWIDGKPLYQKTFNIGSLPSTADSDLEFSHNLTNIEHIWVYDAIYENSTTGYTNRANLSNSSWQTSWFTGVDKTVIHMVTGSSRQVYDYCYVTLRYTKTTDTAPSS